MPSHTHPPPSQQHHSHMQQSLSHSQPFPHSHAGSHSSPSHHYQSAVDSDPYQHAAPLNLTSPLASSSASQTPSHGHSHSHSQSLSSHSGFFSPSAAAASAGDSSHQTVSAPSPSHQWSSSGKLKAAARSIFERAYGLNGRQREDHSALCDEVMRMTACSAKSFEELVYGHSYESELGELRKLVSDYQPKQAKKKERGGGRATSAAAMGKKRDKGSDEMIMSAMSPLARQSSAASVSSRSLLMPLYSQYPAATTPVSASRYEIAYGASAASLPPRRKSLDANMMYGPQANHHPHAPHHTHSSTSFMSPSPSSFHAAHTAAPSAYHDSESGVTFSSSSSLTPSHSGMRHRPNFASAAAAAAAAADSVVAYVASTPTMAVLNGGWGGGYALSKGNTAGVECVGLLVCARCYHCSHRFLLGCCLVSLARFLLQPICLLSACPASLVSSALLFLVSYLAAAFPVSVFLTATWHDARSSHTRLNQDVATSAQHQTDLTAASQPDLTAASQPILHFHLPVAHCPSSACLEWVLRSQLTLLVSLQHSTARIACSGSTASHHTDTQQSTHHRHDRRW